MIVEVKKEIAYFDIGNVIADNDSYEDFYGLYSLDVVDYDYGPRPLSLLETVQYFIEIGMTEDRLVKVNRLANVLTENQCQYEFAFLWMMTDSRFPVENVIVKGPRNQLFEVTQIHNSTYSVDPLKLPDRVEDEGEQAERHHEQGAAGYDNRRIVECNVGIGAVNEYAVNHPDLIGIDVIVVIIVAELSEAVERLNRFKVGLRK